MTTSFTRMSTIVSGGTTTAGDIAEQTTEDMHHVDMALAEDMHYFTSVYVGTVLVVVGLVGNILSIVVWLRKNMRSSIATYLIGQAVADAGLLLFFFVTDSLPVMVPGIKTSYSYGVFFSYIGYPVFYLFVVCSIWFTVCLTLDRYIHVCWIMLAKVPWTARRPFVTLGGTALLCFIINVPHFCTYEPVPDSDRKSSNPGFQLSDFGTSSGSENYEFWVHCMFLVLVPWAMIFTLNMLIIRKVNKSNSRMDSSLSSKSKENAKKSESQLTRLLLTVTFTFLVLMALQCITQCFYMLKKGNRKIVNEAYAVAKLGVVINSAINFLLYCVSGQRFRKELKMVVCGGKYSCGRKRSLSYEYSVSTTMSDLDRKGSSSATI